MSTWDAPLVTAPVTTSHLFDRWSRTYDSPTLQRLTYRPIHDAVMRRLRRDRPGSVLDLGCGTGQLTERLVREFPDARVVGLDLSVGMLDEAADRLDTRPAARLVCADAERLPLGPASFDAVVCTESFHWYDDQGLALREIARVLRPGGRLIIVSIATLTEAGDRLLRRATRRAGAPIRALPPHRLRRLAVDAGFDVVDQRRIPRAGLVPWPVLTEARLPTP